MSQAMLVIILIIGVILLLALVAHIFFIKLLNADIKDENNTNSSIIIGYEKNQEKRYTSTTKEFTIALSFSQ